MTTSALDRLFAEVDRQLNDVRITADGLATRAGLLISATALGAGLLGSRLQTLHTGPAVAALIVLGVATLVGGTVLTPGLRRGPTPSDLSRWLGEPATPTIKALYAAKIATLESNRTRLTVMRVLLYVQGVTVIAAIVLVVVAASER